MASPHALMSASTGDQRPQRARLRYATVSGNEEEIRWDTEQRYATRCGR
jgi:hypothetical protein